ARAGSRARRRQRASTSPGPARTPHRPHRSLEISVARRRRIMYAYGRAPPRDHRQLLAPRARDLPREGGVSPLRGYTAPLSPDGRAGIVPPPPWHYSGDFLIAEYRTDPRAVAALLPAELEPAEDPGAVAAIFADWQSCSADLHELVDPIQSQYREFFIVVGARYQGQPVSRCVYIWVDKDFAMYRGWIQAFPKKLGSIPMT